jgi:hypothetical protein
MRAFETPARQAKPRARSGRSRRSRCVVRADLPAWPAHRAKGVRDKRRPRRARCIYSVTADLQGARVSGTHTLPAASAADGIHPIRFLHPTRLRASPDEVFAPQALAPKYGMHVLVP